MALLKLWKLPGVQQYRVMVCPILTPACSPSAGQSLARPAGVTELLCSVAGGKPQLPPCCSEPETAAANGAAAILTGQSFFLEGVSSRDAQVI